MSRRSCLFSFCSSLTSSARSTRVGEAAPEEEAAEEEEDEDVAAVFVIVVVPPPLLPPPGKANPSHGMGTEREARGREKGL